ncbi:MAG: HXXEE domain-containing protein [Bryobacteraceae bacterium]
MLSKLKSHWWLALAPVLFAAHVAEEAPGYVRWFNSIVGTPIPESGFVAAQLQPFLAAMFLGVAAAVTGNRWAALILMIWASHFFFANAVYHLVASVALVTYSPGLVTGTLLYLPFFYRLAKHLAARGIAVWALVLLVFFASLPSFIQTYMVVFERRRFY